VALKLLVLGNAVVDRAYDLERLPLPGETLLATARPADVGGKGLNQAAAAHRAGADVRLLAPIGGDTGGHQIRSRLAAEGMDPCSLIEVEGATDESVIMVAASGENAIVSTAAAARAMPLPLALDAIASHSPGDLLLMQGNLERELTAACLRRARECGLTTILNPAPVGFDLAGLTELVDIAIMNEVEAALLGPVPSRAVVVTEGEHGATLRTSDGNLRLPAPPAHAVDTTGAGDVVCGVLAAGLALGLPIADALRWGLAAASLKVTRRGAFAGMPSVAEIRVLQP
jgi:ribokinase